MTDLQPSRDARPPVEATTGTYNELRSLVRAAGLLDLRPDYYAAKIAANTFALAVGWALFALLGDSWWQLAVAVYLAVCFGQTSFVMHDIGHRQAWSSRGPTEAMGLLHANVLLGISFGWWTEHHTRHHNHPNHLSLDPDIARRRVIFDISQRSKRTGVIETLIIRHQAWMVYVLPIVDWTRPHLAGIAAVLDGTIKRRKYIDLALLVGHLVAYVAGVFWLLSPARALAFIAVHQAIFSLYLSLAFAPNHKGMPVRDGGSEELDWLTRQVATSRNLRPSRIADAIFGGLHYQIEHHLFPAMSRPNLRKAQPLVKAYCLEHGYPYTEVSIVASYRDITRHLSKVSRQVHRLGPPIDNP